MKMLLVLSAILSLGGCSSGDGQSGDSKVDEHIWKSQTEMINKAENVEGLLQDAAATREQEMDRQAGQ